MKVNSINTINNNYNKFSFKHTAVPYPEFEYAYYNTSNSLLDSISELISKLFSPKVSKETVEIKNQIDNIYDKQADPKKQLLSVLA